MSEESNRDLIRMVKNAAVLAWSGGLVGIFLFTYLGSLTGSLAAAAVIGSCLAVLYSRDWPSGALGAVLSALTSYIGLTVSTAVGSVAVGAVAAILAGVMLYGFAVFAYIALAYGHGGFARFLRHVLYGLCFAGAGAFAGTLVVAAVSFVFGQTAFGPFLAALVGLVVSGESGAALTRRIWIKEDWAISLSAVSSQLAALVGVLAAAALTHVHGVAGGALLGALSGAVAGCLIYSLLTFAGLAYGHGYAFWRGRR